eukprot:1625216-Pleurochrysis_carterae.AAC.2
MLILARTGTVLVPPTCAGCEECWQARLGRDVREGLSPGDTRSVVYFCEEAPSTHCGKVIRSELSVCLRATTSGMIRSAACCLWRKMGDLWAPRSVGCSRMY